MVRALEAHAAARPLRLCVPGHGGGAYRSPALERALARHGVWALDWTEVPGLDDLAWPHGPIRAAEAALAEAFGAFGAAILVGGSTAGILATILAFGRGRDVALGPTQHRSVYAALALAGARPLFLPERVDAATGLVLGLEPEAAARAITLGRPALVVALYPTYQGTAGRLTAVAEAAHAAGALVLADSAHGAHFGLDPRLPAPALSAGADVAVLGLHKTLGALTQTALLAWREGVDGERLRAALRLLQSSSPSYPLMASADSAGQDMARSGARRWRHALDRAERVRTLLGEELWRPRAEQDPSRVYWLSPTGRGEDLFASLRDAGCEPEYGDERGVLLLLGPNLGARDLGRLEAVVGQVRQRLAALPRGTQSPPGGGDRVRPAVPGHPDAMLDAMGASWQAVPLAAAAGRTAADFLTPYPPGTPIALPGARLDGRVLERVAAALAAGRQVQGVGPGSTIRVVRTEGGSPS